MLQGDRVISKRKNKSAQKPPPATSGGSATSGQDDRRRHPRYAEPCLRVALGEDTFDTINWSMGGMMLGDYKGTLSVGSIFKIAALGKADGGVMNDVAVHGRVVRVDDDGKTIAFDFMEVDGRGYALLQAFMAERMALLNEDNPII